MTKPDFQNYDFQGGGGGGPTWANVKSFWVFSCFFLKVSAILTTRTMTFGHKDYINTPKKHTQKSEKFKFNF